MEDPRTTHFIEEACDPESPQYCNDLSWWVGQLRETKQRTRTVGEDTLAYLLYHACRGVFEASKGCAGYDPAQAVYVGEAVLEELTRALPCTAEGSNAWMNILQLIEKIRQGVERSRLMTHP
ncbi:MAG: hypothetical protein WC698_03455 [Candidatus Peribacteraceae bacterium]